MLMAADPKLLVPENGAPPVGPYSPGLETSEYVYASGQGVRNSKSEMPDGIEAQTLQCVENVRVILEAARLTPGDVVSVQLYLADLKNLAVVEKIYRKAFPHNPPRVTLGMARMPTDTTVEITVVARKKIAKRPSLVYLPAVYGSTSAEAGAKLDAALRVRKMNRSNVVFANRYAVGGDHAGIVPVNALPDGAAHAIFAIAAAKPLKDLAFCEVTSSDPAGSIEEQTANVFAKLKSCLAGKSMQLSNAVATNVYVDDLADFSKMNAVYATFFPGTKPTRTTVQPLPPAKSGSLLRISVMAAQ